MGRGAVVTAVVMTACAERVHRHSPYTQLHYCYNWSIHLNPWVSPQATPAYVFHLSILYNYLHSYAWFWRASCQIAIFLLKAQPVLSGKHYFCGAQLFSGTRESSSTCSFGRKDMWKERAERKHCFLPSFPSCYYFQMSQTAKILE